MARRAEFSAQTLSVLAALCADPREWQHGYGIAGFTGLKSGSLYPILIRLADRGLVEARWEEGQPVGRPRRHLYRLTPEGLASAKAALADAPAPDRADARRQAGRRSAVRGMQWAD
jgi:DNA-binding PadR family transcriptional regulator